MRAQLRGDPMVGTAFPAARVLLVEQPGPWGPDALTGSRFDRAAASALVRHANAAGVRVQAVRRPGRDAGAVERRWALVDSRPGRERLRWGTFPDDASLLDLPLDGTAGEPDDEPIYLVCAHGRHDACCALRGRPVAAAFETVRPGRVWETTHLGGDRFAANVLVLPAGVLYGRVLPFAAPGLVAAAEADEVVAGLLRGRIGYPPAVQSAMAYAAERLALRRRTDVRLRASRRMEDGTWRVVLDVPSGAVEVTVRDEVRVAEGLTCSAPGPGRYLAHRAVGMTAIR
jgi:rhodanese-related sulfurtransferase